MQHIKTFKSNDLDIQVSLYSSQTTGYISMRFERHVGKVPRYIGVHALCEVKELLEIVQDYLDEHCEETLSCGYKIKEG